MSQLADESISKLSNCQIVKLSHCHIVTLANWQIGKLDSAKIRIYFLFFDKLKFVEKSFFTIKKIVLLCLQKSSNKSLRYE